MTYLDTANLVRDPEFQGRIMAAASEQALIFVADSRPEFSEPAQRVILSSGNAVPFISLVAGMPGISAASTDQDILAALQNVWPIYGAALIGGA
jgi:hypothetical protein